MPSLLNDSLFVPNILTSAVALMVKLPVFLFANMAWFDIVRSEALDQVVTPARLSVDAVRVHGPVRK